MLPNAMILAERLWPKATEVDFELLAKVLARVPEDKAKSILEDARIESKYNAIPLKDIKARVRKTGSGDSVGNYIDCWAVHQDTKKFKECCVRANDRYGATVMMQQWLKNRCRVEPTDYAIFVGKENFRTFFNYRMGIEETVEVEDF